MSYEQAGSWVVVTASEGRVEKVDGGFFPIPLIETLTVLVSPSAKNTLQCERSIRRRQRFERKGKLLSGTQKAIMSLASQLVDTARFEQRLPLSNQ
jgi:hypothetical protein